MDDGPMIDLLMLVVELIACLWSADWQVRGETRLGESPQDRSDRWIAAWVCGGLIVVLGLIGIILAILWD